MGSEDGEDTQKLKRIGAAAYDYDDDSRWADYWSNILIPPHLASRNDVVEHYKRKFYQRYIDPDLVVEAMTTSSSSQSGTTSKSPQQSSSSTASTSDTRQRSSGSSGRTSGASTTPPINSTSLRWDKQTIQFSANAWVFCCGSHCHFSTCSEEPLKSGILTLLFWNCMFFLVLIVYTIWGKVLDKPMFQNMSSYSKPRAWNLQALQVWFQSVLESKDFMYSVYCLIFVSSHPCLKFALLPIICRALEYVAKFLRRNFSRSTLYSTCLQGQAVTGKENVRKAWKYLEDACIWVESNTTTLSILSSQAEIGLGFLQIISLLSWQRNIIQAFIYWQLLKLMYHAPAAASYHRSAWSNIGQKTNPLIQRYAPFLNTPMATARKWWLR